jgi:tRNA threonylcarbamoyladenosine biosynthesis protein TsaE
MPILEAQSLEFLSRSPDQTQRIGVRLGELIQAGDLICLAGDLGSGKTTLVQGIARGWGSFDPVTSPSFILINEYRRADHARLYHFDAFRLEGVEEANQMGLADFFELGGPLLIEWPERIAAALPKDHLWISMRWVDDLVRGMHFDGKGIRYERLLESFRQSAFGR